MFNNNEDARDLAQEALIKIYNNIDKCSNIANFKNWICRITTNACLDEIRRRKGYQTISIDNNDSETSSILDTRAAPDPTPEAALLSQERTLEIADAINQLPETQRALIVLRDIKGLSYEEVATALDMNIGTVKSGIARARLRLREMLK